MTLTAGTKLGRYEIRTVIGVGGRGEVTADCQRFLVNPPVELAKEAPFNVILNWTSTLKK